MKKRLGYKLSILNRTWTVYYLTKATFVKRYSDNTLATTECDDREIYLRLDKLKLETVAHEIMHAYFEEHSLPTMDLSPDQVEELACDIVAKYGLIIHQQANQVIHAYKVLRGRRVR